MFQKVNQLPHKAQNSSSIIQLIFFQLNYLSCQFDFLQQLQISSIIRSIYISRVTFQGLEQTTQKQNNIIQYTFQQYSQPMQRQQESSQPQQINKKPSNVIIQQEHKQYNTLSSCAKEQKENSLSLMSQFNKTLMYGSIFFTLIYGIAAISLNIQCSINNENTNEFYQSISNPFSKFINRVSNFQSIYVCQLNAIILSILFIIIIITFYLFLLLIQSWILFKYNKLKSKQSSVQNFGILLTSKTKLSPKQKSDVKEYLHNFVQVCLKQKIAELILQQRENVNNKNQQRKKTINFLNQLCLKRNVIQKIIFLNTHFDNIANQAQRLRKPQNLSKINQPQTSTDSAKNIVVLFTYEYIADTIVDYWNRQQELRQTVKKDIQNIIKLSHPKDYVYSNVNQNVLTNVRLEDYRFVILSVVLLQAVYVGILAFLVESIYLPNQIFPASVLQSFSVGLSQIFVILFALLLFFTEDFVFNPNNLLMKSLIVYKTDYKLKLQMLKAITKNNIALKIINIIVIPLVAIFLAVWRKNGLTLNSSSFSLKYALFGQSGLNVLIFYYILTKWIFKPVFCFIIQQLKHSKNNEANYQQDQNKKISEWKQAVFRQYQSLQHFNGKACNILSYFMITVLFCFLLNSFYLIMSIFGITLQIFMSKNININPQLSMRLSLSSTYKYLFQLSSVVKKTFLFVAVITGSLVSLYAYLNSILQIYFLFIVIFVLILLISIDSLIFNTSNLQNFKLNRIVSFQQKSLSSKAFAKLASLFFSGIQYEETKYDLNQHLINQNNQISKRSQVKSSNRKYNYINFQNGSLHHYKHQSKFFQYNFQIQMKRLIDPSLLIKQQIQNIRVQQMQRNINSTQKNKITQQLNTMTQTIQQTLKQRLFKNTANPFQIIYQEDQMQDIDFQFEEKVHMKKLTPKVKVPLLFKAQNRQVLLKKHNIRNTENIYSNISKKQQSNLNRKRVQSSVSKNSSFDSKKHSNQFRSVNSSKKKSFSKGMSSSELQYDLPSSYMQKSSKSGYSSKQWSRLKQKRLSGQIIQHISQQLQSYDKTSESNKPVIKLANLFDSDQESIKHLVRKKIKQSIQKLKY